MPLVLEIQERLHQLEATHSIHVDAELVAARRAILFEEEESLRLERLLHQTREERHRLLLAPEIGDEAAWAVAAPALPEDMRACAAERTSSSTTTTTTTTGNAGGCPHVGEAIDGHASPLFVSSLDHARLCELGALFVSHTLSRRRHRRRYLVWGMQRWVQELPTFRLQTLQREELIDKEKLAKKEEQEAQEKKVKRAAAARLNRSRMPADLAHAHVHEA